MITETCPDGGVRSRTYFQGGSVATYRYVDQSMLVGQITYAHNGTTRNDDHQAARRPEPPAIDLLGIGRTDA